MYKIFVGDKPIILTTHVWPEVDFKNFLLKTVHIGKVLKMLKETTLQEVRLIDNNPDKLIKQFLKLLPNVVAGGGKVINQKGEILFIFRNGKWDLPKGGTEKNETIQETAIREVEEETGVKGLSITRPMDTTYHIFKRNGQHRIKITYWFEMQTQHSGRLKPQTKEGISHVKWFNEVETQSVLKQAYANIKLLFNTEQTQNKAFATASMLDDFPME